jgi:hypothetical protein
MQLGEVIRGFDDEANAAEALVACGDVALLAHVDAMISRFGETVGEYASGAVRRFSGLAESEDWLGLMNILERTSDPGTGCLIYMVGWSLKRDEAMAAAPDEGSPSHEGCTCGGHGGCS